MRIVGGRLRGRTLAGPRNDNIRPTSDRVRESLFNILQHGRGAVALEGTRVIDLYAGTGALGIEALSRGAAFSLFVEQAPESRAIIRANIETFALTGVSKIFRRDAANLGPIGTMAPFNLAFLDPPYGQGLGERALASLRAGGWLALGAVAVVEEHAQTELALVPGFDVLDQRIYGDTQIVIFRLTSSL